MPELPEITIIARQMDRETAGKSIEVVEVRQPKNLNMPVQEFVDGVLRKTVTSVSSRGKWLFAKLDPSYTMLINLGMGAEILHYTPGRELPANRQFQLAFSDGAGFTIHFWWFGYVHLVPEDRLSEHKLTAHLGVPAMDPGLTRDRFKALLARKRTGVKSFLLDQRNVSGIGNVYIHDILFMAGVHPNRKMSTLSEKEATGLYHAMRTILGRSVELGGLAYESDFYGRRGRFSADEFLVGYKRGKPCPTCSSTIEKLKTGSTSSYVCPKCQTL